MVNFFNAPPATQRKVAVGLSYIDIFISTILMFVYTPFFLRALGQGEYGLFSLASSVIGYLAILDLGFGNAIVVYTAKYIASGETEKEKKLHGTIFSIYLAMSAISLIVGLVLIFFASQIFGEKLNLEEIKKLKIMFALLTFNLVLSFPFSIYSSILTAYENFIFLKILRILKTLLLPILAIPILLLGYKSISIVVILSLINLFAILSIYIFCKKKINPEISVANFDKITLKEIFAYSFFIFLGMIVDQVNWHVDNFILGVVAGTTAVSLYAVANSVNTMFLTLSGTISGVMLPKISKMVSANSSNDELTNEFIKVGRLQFYIIFFICSLTILFGREFIMLWAGREYEISYYIAIILVIPVSVPLVQNLGLAILQAKNKFKFRAVVAFLMTFVNIAISIPLAKMYGGIGSAIGTAFSLIVLNIIIMNFYYHFKIGLNMVKFWKNILKMFVIFLIPVIIILPLIWKLNLNGVAYLLVCGGIYTAIYAIVAFKLNMNDYEKAIFSNAFAKIRSKF
ncbi:MULTISPECIES: oligosaccharide flippase family protein [unclassified Campylobacter]|uniref:oligosaccharide flippase family protein n=1 Tax=unclassified Campylobacter TaxID=2593542 RepID=UPI0022E9F4F5|nr:MULTISPECIES: oligosaccharide flippase family protein [unclassified Campylobacter]MDA3042874.1 oligosaccharide flippase family protein [Campylobacter sp. JMF_09 ED2]MDA3044291.1 oligosaccharide flippase family protein [Campylobacter sp. JMF_07 ED4]MDA3063640.1 oligosaccharide flippase family protein [Campylobacter sp. JMF_11 EL3]MDA3071266.1 oligosaccharide flippase family protein [Campylobacter sp. VBCF_03 NA9]MDA3074726.1 oligosaccharide flippase family protein [Campylobacter sp. JMF_05 E